MRLFIPFLLAGLLSSCLAPPARSQTAQVVDTCGTLPLVYQPGAVRNVVQDKNGLLCTGAVITGGGDATAANQVLQIAQETAFNTALGAIADTACATDNGSCSAIALIKRNNQRLTTINTTLGTPMQATGGTVGLVAGVAEIGNVKNSGTFAVQATLAAETTKVIGTVNQGTSPWVISGALTANQSVNVAQINGVAPLMGAGNTGTGSPRVTIASDQAAIPVNATLSAETTKVIGTINVAAAQTIATTNAGTFAVQAQPTPVTSGGLSLYFVQPTASDNHAVIKAGAGQVYHISVTNNSATVNYLRLYNATTGFNGCNSATNLVGQWAIPASTSVGGLSMNVGMGVAFATGISICVTSGYATNDTTNATASAMSVNVGYK